MKNTTKQGRKRKLKPSVKSGRKISGKVGYTQSNKTISTLRKLIQTDIKNGDNNTTA